MLDFNRQEMIVFISNHNKEYTLISFLFFGRNVVMEKSILRGSFNRILHLMARLGPGATTIRPFLHKIRGVKIYGNVFIGDDVRALNFPKYVKGSLI